MEFITYFAVGEEELRQIVRLIVLMIPLFILPMLLKSSNSLIGKIGNVADRVSRDMGVERGAGKIKSGVGGGMKRAPGLRNVGEMMEQRKALREQAYGKNKARRAAARGAAGGWRGRVIGGVIPTETTRTAQEAMAGQAAGQLYNLEQEEIKNRHAIIMNDKNYGSDSVGVAERALVNAYHNGDGAGIRAATAELSNSAYGTKRLHSIIHGLENGTYINGAGEQQAVRTMSEDDRKVFATAVNDNWTALKSKDAAITSWSGDQLGRQLGALQGDSRGANTVSGDAATYTGLRTEELAGQNPEALTNALNATQSMKKDGDKTVTESKEGLSKSTAAAVLSSDSRAKLTPETRKIFESRVSQPQPQTAPNTEPHAATGGRNFDDSSPGGVRIPR